MSGNQPIVKLGGFMGAIRGLPFGVKNDFLNRFSKTAGIDDEWQYLGPLDPHGILCRRHAEKLVEFLAAAGFAFVPGINVVIYLLKMGTTIDTGGNEIGIKHSIASHE